VAIPNRVAARSVIEDQPTIDGLVLGSRLFLASEVITIVIGVFAIVIIRSVIGRQDGLLARQVEEEAAPPRPDVPGLPS
jgi:hypothetical protein